MNEFSRQLSVRNLIFVSIALFLVLVTVTQARSENMTNENEPAPSVDALIPYQSTIESFRRKMPADEEIAFVVTITSPAESYATMIQRELESKTEYGINVTVTPLRDPQTREVKSWRIYAVSKPLQLGELSEEKHHAIAGWAFGVAGYFQSTMLSFSYQL